MWALLQAALLLGPLRPLVNPGRDSSSYLLEELIVRAPQPCSTRVYHQRDSLLVFIVRAVIPLPRAGVTGITSLLLLSPSRTHGLRDFPS